jgi:hypothetical protein
MSKGLVLVVLVVFIACGDDGDRQSANHGPEIPYRVLEGSFLVSSPDPPDAAGVVTEPLAGTFTLVPLDPGRNVLFSFDVTQLHLSAGSRFTIDGRFGGIREGFNRGGGATEGVLSMSIDVLVNGEREQLGGVGPYRLEGDEPLVLDGIEICTNLSRLRPCEEVRMGNAAGLFLMIYALPAAD